MTSKATGEPGQRVRASVRIPTDRSKAAQAAAFLDWFGRHEEALFYVSSNHGCACCDDRFDLEGPAEVIATLSPEWGGPSDWARDGVEAPKVRQVPPRLKLLALGSGARSPRRR